MCDTVVALGSVTADGVTLFGKNSDREPNEAQHLLRVPGGRHAPGSTLRCTYIEVPQIAETYEALLSRPFWMWGAEMGANEHGVVIGNEAVFTKVPYEKEGGLIGMDLLRLGLERARTAREALDVMTGLLETFGQGGNCGMAHSLYYHNSFLIADPTSAWVLETAGKQWAAEQVKGIRTISNGITIGGEFDLASDDLVAYAVDHGWCKGRDDFHFGRCYSDFVYTRFSFSSPRQCRTTELLERHKGQITVETIMSVLRDHGPGDPDAGPAWSPATGIAKRQVCQHAGWGPIRGDQSAGSLVSHIAAGVQTHFVTASSAPCTGIYKPVWLGSDLPDSGPQPSATYDEASLFWRHETLHRATLRDYAGRLPLYADERDTLEREFVAGAMGCREASQEERAGYAAQCFAQADEAEARWTARVLGAGGGARQGPLYASAWRKFNREAGMKESD